MSVTFRCPEAPKEIVVPYDDEPEYSEERSVSPYTELNFANSNASDILRQIDPNADFESLCGRYSGATLDTVIANTLLALNSKTEVLVKPTTRDGNIISFGRDPDYVERRLGELLSLFVAAKKAGYSVVFS